MPGSRDRADAEERPADEPTADETPELGLGHPEYGPGVPSYGETQRDDRDLWQGQHDGPRPVKLIQGYAWHPRELAIDLRTLLPAELAKDVHLLVDPMPQAPFTFFGDGTLSATQQVYQVTVLAIVQPGQDPARMLPEIANTLGPHLDATPEGVGWQLMEDLREVG